MLTSTPPKNAGLKQGIKIALSSFLVAFLIFYLCNFFVTFFYHNEPEANDIWIEEAHTATSGYSRLATPADVVFLGSSMIRSPMWCADHTLDKNIFYSNYHKTKFFEKELKAAGINLVGYNMGIDGVYVSDMLLLFDQLLAKNPPRLLICAITPREFFTNWFQSAKSTPVYKLLSQPAHYFRNGQLYSADDLDWFDGAVTQLTPMRRGSTRFQQQVSTTLQDRLSPQKKETEKAATFATPQNAFAPGVAKLKSTLTEKTKDTSMKVKMRLYNNQKKSLKELLRSASNRGVKVLIVSMPLPKVITSEIQPALQADYSAFLREIEKSSLADVLDLEFDPTLSQTANFMDDWHLNEKGGIELIHRIVAHIAQHPSLLKKTAP